ITVSHAVFLRCFGDHRYLHSFPTRRSSDLLKYPADFKAKIISNTLQGLELDIQGKTVWFRLIGGFNAYNLLATLGASILLGEEEEEAMMQLSKMRSEERRVGE